MKTTFRNCIAMTIFVGFAGSPALADGGETCPTATLVSSVPFIDNGTTCGANDDYDEQCDQLSGAPDVVYRLMPASAQCVNVSLCNGTAFDAKLYVYSSATGNCPPIGTGNSNLDIACAEDGCPGAGALIPRIANLQLDGGVTYWFVVDGANDACGNYQVTFSACPAACDVDSDCCDGNFCNGREICGPGGVCQAGFLSCDDENPCTIDSCNDELDTCIHSPVPGCCLVDEHCEDANPCTNDQCDRPDACSPGTCMNPPRAAGAPCGNQESSPCNLPNICDGEGTCKPNFVPDGSTCNDGRFCTQGTTCTGGVCGDGSPRDCDDGNPCTQERCDEETQSCEFRSRENCCVVDGDCDDGKECTDNLCDQGTCVHPPLATGTPCGSAAVTPCTGAGSCQLGFCRPNHVSNGETCDDGDECTLNDACLAGSCRGQPNPDCADGPLSGGLAPKKLSFQAFLTDADGVPLNEYVELKFQLYDDQGAPLGPPIDLPDVMVQHGVVSTQIETPFGAFNFVPREMGVQVNGGPELAPRIPLASAAYALSVDKVGSKQLGSHVDLGGGTAGGELRILGPAGTAAARGYEGALVIAGTRSELDTDGTLHFCGRTSLADGSGDETVMIDACDPTTIAFGGFGGGQIRLAGSDGVVQIRLDASNSPENAAELVMYADDGTTAAVKLVTSESGTDGAQLTLRNSQGNAGVILDSESAQGSHLYLRDEGGNHRMVEIAAEQDGQGAQIMLRSSDGKDAVRIDAESSTGAKIRLYQEDYNEDSASLADDIGILLDGNYDAGFGGYGRIRVRNEAGDSRIYIDGDYNGTGKGRVRTDILRIEGGSDLSESFDVQGTDVRPGYLVSIDPLHPGRLAVSSTPYDQRLAGVISGAGGIDPGLVMGQAGSIADGEHPVAMAGRVYCWADARRSPIEPGDLLTTSEVPGHAMRADDPARIPGAVIGKAMSPLSEGRGLVLVLIRPQ